MNLYPNMAAPLNDLGINYTVGLAWVRKQKVSRTTHTETQSAQEGTCSRGETESMEKTCLLSRMGIKIIHNTACEVGAIHELPLRNINPWLIAPTKWIAPWNTKFVNSENQSNHTNHRRSIRLPGYDYSSEGSYFVTIVTYKRKPLFGEIVNGKIHNSDAGKIVLDVCHSLPNWYPGIELGSPLSCPTIFTPSLIS